MDKLNWVIGASGLIWCTISLYIAILAYQQKKISQRIDQLTALTKDTE